MKKLKLIKDWGDRKKGETFNTGNKGADELARLGYALYWDNSENGWRKVEQVDIPSESIGCVEKKKEVEKVDIGRETYNNNNNNIIIPLPMPPTSTPSFEIKFEQKGKTKLLFETNFKYINTAVGVLNGKYYYGISSLGEKEVETKYGLMKKKQRCSFLVTSDRELLCPSDMDNIECPDLIIQNQWELFRVEDYLNVMDIPKTPEEVFNNVINQYKEYMDFQDEGDYDLLALWDIGTYFFSLMSSYPYLHLHAFKGSGKTKAMDVSSCMSFNARRGSVLTPSVMFRVVEADMPTLYLDEFEIEENKNKKKDDEKDIILLLNAGYKRGGTAMRNEKEGNKWIPKEFKVYCPKMIANISGLTGALASRTIKIVLLRAKKNDNRANKEVRPEDSQWKHIRNDLYLLGLHNWRNVKSVYESYKPVNNISNRDWELWKPLIALSKFISPEVNKRFIEYATEKINQRENEEVSVSSWENLLLEVLGLKVKEGRFYSIKNEIKQWLWDECFLEEEGFDNFKQTTYKRYTKVKPSERWISGVLRKLGNIEFRRVKGITEVKLDNKLIKNLESRLQAKTSFKVEEKQEVIISEIV